MVSYWRVISPNKANKARLSHLQQVKTFCVSFDGLAIDETFSFGISQIGKMQLYFPISYSPLGAPASCAAKGVFSIIPKHVLALRLRKRKVD